MIQRVTKMIDKNELIIETGRIAKQADAAVTVQMGDTVVLVTCVCSKGVRTGIDYLPLMVEYREKTYAAGKIPGGFFKREGRPSEKEILTARLIDRPIRPLFPEDMINDIQVVSMVLSSDGENDSDILAVIGASCALSISDIPFDGPIGCVRIGMIDDKFVINPTFQEMEMSALDLVIADHKGKTIMIEAGGKELTEEKIEEGFDYAQKYLKEIAGLQSELVAKCGKKKREDIVIRRAGEELLLKVKEASQDRLNEINKLSLKDQREEALTMLTKELVEKFVTKEGSVETWEVKSALDSLEKEVVRSHMLKSDKRIDSRTYKDIRPIECSAGFLPRTHGSGLFTRGQTQALCVTTLGTSADEQRIDALEGETQKSFMLHYNFPSFSVGEVKPFRGPGRREIGHGALAEKALKPVMPSGETFPYTVRIVSDILESNGSSSMASACAASISLMDAGVPIKSSVAGIAIGLVSKGDQRVFLTDIAGLEDHYGDMDFKVAGTRNGITAIQMDLKIKGLDKEGLKEALSMAREARFKVLDIMDGVISTPKESISDFAPRIVNLKVNPEKIKDIIGPGGKIIKKIIRDYGVTVDVDDDGSVQVASNDEKAIQAAIDVIKGLTASVEVGKIYSGTITRIMNFGAFCEILPGKEGLIHVSELANKFVKEVTQEVNVGDKVNVKVIEIDQQGRVNLSKKQAEATEGDPS
ncbi:MAG: polyribonucleotide nucleotidyltransferase [Candidatus Omnitrophota bacterium]